MRELTTVAKAAKQIRVILKEKFPKMKFRVKSENYSMGDSIRVYWTDGPTADEVGMFVNHYQYGDFNGMEDIYEYTNTREDIPQTKYLFLERSYSDDIQLKASQAAKKMYAGLDNVPAPETESDLSKSFHAFDNWFNWAQISYRILVTMNLENAVDIVDDDSVSGTLFSGFKAVKSAEVM